DAAADAQLLRVSVEPILAEQLAQVVQSLAQRLAGVRLVALRPEHGEQGRARDAALDGEVDEERGAQALGGQPVELRVVTERAQAAECGEPDRHGPVPWSSRDAAPPEAPPPRTTTAPPRPGPPR